MARRSSRSSVYNKRSNERVQSAQASGTSTSTYVKSNQAHAQSSQNPTQDRQVQSQPSTDPWERASQFASNVGRGASDVGRSYTTDFYDMGEAALTGKEQKERSYQDETLAGVFGRGLFEGNLHGAVDEAGRRITQEPGRVVGEVAAEAAILGATMGFGAALKGVRIGAAGVKAGAKTVRNTKTVAKTKVSQGEVLGNRMVSGYTRNTGRLSPFNRGGKEFISSPGGFKKGQTLTIKTNKKGKETAKVTKDLSITGWTRGITSRSAVMGNSFAQRMGRTQSFIAPVVAGGSKPLSAADNLKPETFSAAVTKGKVVANKDVVNTNEGYMQQYEQFQQGQLPRQYTPGEGFNISTPQKQAGMFEGVAAPTRSPTRGVLEFNEPITRIGGMSDNTTPTGVLDARDINPSYYQGKDGKYYASKLNDSTRPTANKLVKEFTAKIKKDKGLKAARERSSNVDMAANDETRVMEMMGGSPTSVPIAKADTLSVVKAEIFRTISGGGTEAQARARANEIIKVNTKETIKQDALVAKENAGNLSSLGTSTEGLPSPVKYNLIEEARPTVRTDPDTGGLVKIKYDTEPNPIAFGENYGTYGKKAGAFDDANSAMYRLGGALEEGAAEVKDGQNVGSVANRYDTAVEYRNSLSYFSPKDDAKFIQQYNAIRQAKPGAKSALASKKARQSLPSTPEQFMMKFGLSKKETKDLFFAKGYGKKADTKKIQRRKQKELTQGDMSGIERDAYPVEEGKWTKQQIKETGINPPRFVKEQNERITDPREDVDSILATVTYDIGSIYTSNRMPGVRKSSVGRIPLDSTKTPITMYENLVGFNIKNVRSTVDGIGTTVARRRVSKPAPTRRLTGDRRGKTAKAQAQAKPKKIKGQDAINAELRRLYGDSSQLPTNPDTGMIDNTLGNRMFTIPSWMGDTTVMGGGRNKRPNANTYGLW